ncbi:MAG: tetratricopeptide repeat protein [Alphaproteobacteria bacterium]
MSNPGRVKKSIKQQINQDSHPRYAWAIPLFIAAITIVAFYPVLKNGFINWDDDYNVLQNPFYRGLGWSNLQWMFTTFHMTLYRPLTWVTLGLDYVLWGMNPFGYHLSSVILHTANAVIFYFVSLRLFSTQNNAVPEDLRLRTAALVAALVFALHPLRVEPVAWVSGRENLVSGFFFLLAILWYLRAVGSAENTSGQYWFWIGAAWASYSLSLLGKAAAVTLPFALVVLDIYPLRRLKADVRTWFDTHTRRVWWEKVLFAVPASGAWVIGVLAKGHFGTVASLEDFGLLTRLNQVMYGLVFYVWKTIAPLGLSPLYERPTYVAEAGIFDFRSAIALAAITVFFVLTRRRFPAGLASWIFYGLILIPVLGFIPFGPQIVADRYSYLPCLVWAILAGAAVLHWPHPELNRRIRARGFSPAGVLATLVLVTFVFLTWKQSQIWHDSETLWRYALTIDQRSAFAHNNLGVALEERGNVQEGVQQVREALRIDPAFAEAHNNLGYFLAKQGLLDEGIRELREAVQLKPAYATARNNLGNALAERGAVDESVEQFRETLRMSPDSADAHYNLGRVLASQNKLDDAVAHYRQAAKLRPEAVDIHNNLGAVLLKQGKTDEAVEQFREALRINPRYAKAHFNLGRAYADQAKFDEAVRQFQDALEIDPDVAEIHAVLARVLTLTGKKDEAVRHYEEALRLLRMRPVAAGRD